MITVVQAPDNYELPDGSYAFYFNNISNTLICKPFAAPGTCISPDSLVVADTEQECLDYMTKNNIIIPEWIAQ